ncbi:MAG: hypothetical protein WCO56_18705 [Verrucomicrobiota bacterium]
MTVDLFKTEIEKALKAYDKYIICVDKTPDECETSLRSLVVKAIDAYEKRGANLRHGIALDRHLTVIISQTDGDRPACGIYFNLHSPYQHKLASKPARSAQT